MVEFCLLLTTSRSVLELFLNKQIAYQIQVFAMFMLAYVYFRVANIGARLIFAYLALFFLASISFINTLLDPVLSIYSIVVVFGVNFINLFYIIAAISINISRPRIEVDVGLLSRINKILILNIFVFASLQYFGYLEFPGSYGFNDNLRLSGSFGSMQHLSIVIAILGLIQLYLVVHEKRIIDAIFFLMAFVVIVVAFTRIGYFIFFLTIVFALFNEFARNRFAIPLKYLTGFVVTFLTSVFVGFYFFPDIIFDFLMRVSSVGLDDYSNAERFWHWSNGLSSFMSGSILISDITGFASQIPLILFGERSSHFESGHLQYLVNFGLLFWLIIILLFIAWLKSFNFSGLFSWFPLVIFLALFIYMFNEVVPVFVLFPLISFFNKVSK